MIIMEVMYIYKHHKKNQFENGAKRHIKKPTTDLIYPVHQSYQNFRIQEHKINNTDKKTKTKIH